MSLDNLVYKVKNIMDYEPGNTGYNNQIHELLNAAYLQIWTSKLWNFASKTTFLNLYPDLTSASVGGATAAYVDGQRAVIFSAGIPILISQREQWEGNIIQIEGREYTIVAVTSTTQVVVDEPIRLQNGVASVSGNTDWIIKIRYHRLPEDLIEILSMNNRDIPLANGSGGTTSFTPTGKIRGMSPSYEEDLNLRQDFTNTFAEIYVPTPPVVVPNAEKLSGTFTQVVDNSGDGDLVQGYYYEICWAFEGPDGSVGPLSEPQVFQVTADAQAPTKKYKMTLNFLTFDDKPVFSKNSNYTVGPGGRRPLEGLRKRLYYNQYMNPTTGERLGRPLWRELITGYNTNVGSPALSVNTQDDVIRVADTVSTVDITNKNSFDPGTKQYIKFDGQYPRVRFYPRPNAYDLEYDFVAVGATTPKRTNDFLRKIQLRYYRKPFPLIASTDTPELPYEFHDAIVYKALEDLFNKNGDRSLSTYYAKKAKDELARLEKRYVDFVDVNYRKGQWAYGGRENGLYDYRSVRKLN